MVRAHRQISVLAAMILFIGLMMPTTIIAYSLGVQARLYYRDVELNVCNNGHGVYLSGICYTGQVTVTEYARGAVINPITNLCVANCTVISWQRVYNLLTNQGKNYVKSNLGTPSNQSTALVIIISNATFTAAAGDNFCCGGSNISYTGNGGTNLGPGQLTAPSYASTGTGTWTVTKTFTLAVAATATTVGASLSTYCCGAAVGGGVGSQPLTKPNAAGSIFAEGTYSSVTLNTGDSVQVQWSMTAS